MEIEHTCRNLTLLFRGCGDHVKDILTENVKVQLVSSVSSVERETADLALHLSAELYELMLSASK